ncbi:Peptidase A1 domain-containing protein [Mycena venus]|uniref:Peptidase A1 domain-containing protein n=1 Tax=Mycena venus TaxID=2733690 RepID=A0A8H6XDD7_9AGAR|nr:Peptidase A1 domain-containing protein [Mycena venus]
MLQLRPALAGLALFTAASAQRTDLTLPFYRVPRVGQALNNDIALNNVQQFTYVVQATIGKQLFDFVCDTGSSDLWVTSNRCQEQDCKAVPQFSPELSDTLTPTDWPFELRYLTGSVKGQIVRDTVTFGGLYQVESQAFATVYQTADLDLASTGTSGILGLCFPASAAIPATAGPTLLQNLMSAFAPAQQFFAFHLPRQPGSTDPSASFTLGSLDPSLAPDPTAIANSLVVRTGPEYDYWKLSLMRLTVDGKPFPISSSRVLTAKAPVAVLDTGTTLLLRAHPLMSMPFRCTRPVVLGLVLGDPPREYVLHPADVAWAEGAQDGWCTGGVQPNDNVNSGDWLLGDVFLRNVYCVHKYSSPPSIGLLSVTDLSTAMREFREERGEDVDDANIDDSDIVPVVVDGGDGWDTATGYVKRWELHPSGPAAQVFGAAAGGIGFVVGGVSAASWRFWRGV